MYFPIFSTSLFIILGNWARKKLIAWDLVVILKQNWEHVSSTRDFTGEVGLRRWKGHMWCGAWKFWVLIPTWPLSSYVTLAILPLCVIFRDEKRVYRWEGDRRELNVDSKDKDTNIGMWVVHRDKNKLRYCRCCGCLSYSYSFFFAGRDQFILGVYPSLYSCGGPFILPA